jgi:hypothetical protein
VVPEAPVNKNGDLMFREHKVRFAKKVAMPPPATYAPFPEQFDQQLFGCFVSAEADA